MRLPKGKKLSINATAGIDAVLLSVVHLAVDMTTAGFLFSRAIFVLTPEEAAIAILVYNFTAFGLQPFFGLLIDAVHRVRPVLFASLAVIGIFGLFHVHLWLNLVVLSVANAAFHASAASVVIADRPHKASGLGVYVSLGAVGLALGIHFGELPLVIGAVVCLSALTLLPFAAETRYREYYKNEAKRKQPDKRFILPLVLILAAVFIRGFTGSTVNPTWSTRAIDAVYIAFAVAGGKAIGGFLADHFGASVTAVFTLVPAAFLLAFGKDNVACFIIGILLFNTAMPVTLLLAIELLQRFQSFAFGLTAAFLMFGTAFSGGFLEEFGFSPALTAALTVVGAMCIVFGTVFSKRYLGLKLTEPILAKKKIERN